MTKILTIILVSTHPDRCLDQDRKLLQTLRFQVFNNAKEALRKILQNEYSSVHNVLSGKEVDDIRAQMGAKIHRMGAKIHRMEAKIRQMEAKIHRMEVENKNIMYNWSATESKFADMKRRLNEISAAGAAASGQNRPSWSLRSSPHPSVDHRSARYLRSSSHPSVNHRSPKLYRLLNGNLCEPIYPKDATKECKDGLNCTNSNCPFGHKCTPVIFRCPRYFE